ncbi:RagB/SusD family nutrient uptake outer membrane protein [Flavobacterium hydrophilum]|uniref:RagB/SusD family nutrient uptake outer membrane protein n=1 Tax=Flavobacterium hydrophilum TaxID=2211445 RepID=A0A2V4C3Q2_9FLAO|nr:RagB/SusD family nutrient uptake outer membrane protein [Flavobacterium hydrophilum]PXY45966.1 hypothetical protein DMB68_01895 [Flavobacterium hydrophilum]
MKNFSIKYTYIFSFFLLTGLTGCDDMLDVDLPVNELSSENVYVSDPTAEAAVNGIYQSMVASVYYDNLHRILGQTADELIPRTGIANVYSSNEIPDIDGSIGTMWTELYKTIYNANNVIEGVTKSTTLNPVKSKQWIAEAKFLRAYSHFYLTNLWGNVPLILTTNIDVTALAPQSSQEAVYTQILLDLTDASKDLPTNYSNYNDGERIRATKWAAEALLARVNLYLRRWSAAEIHASAVINETGTYKIITGLTDSNNPFIADNDEAILQIPYYNVNYTYEGTAVFGTGGTYLLRKGNALFEAGDDRKTKWTIDIRDRVTNAFIGIAPRKYKANFGQSINERSTVLRLAELYLIRAEARVKLNNITGAQQDIDVIRNRALLGNTTLTDSNQLLELIAMERERELFAENGHRWLDLKRSGNIDQILGSVSDKIWKSTDSLYPIPETAIRSNPSLIPNPGY